MNGRLRHMGFACCLAASLEAAAEDLPPSPPSANSIIVTGKRKKGPAGSASSIDEEKLEAWKPQDPTRVLGRVAGVNVQEEEGFGLRPNIGMRGVHPHRSRKIALLEDGIPIAPAPYAAPAAYYFPSMYRLRKIEVLKGPLALTNGPNTVGGGVNLITKDIPERAGGAVDLAYGAYGFRKGQAGYGVRTGKLGALFLGSHTASSGFQTLSDGADTGFQKSDALLKLAWRFVDTPGARHEMSLKLGSSRERSFSSYLGLTAEDFGDDAYQRYAASQDDAMSWQHRQVQLTDAIELKDGARLRFDAYRNSFSRV